MADAEATVFIIDDDILVRKGLARLLRSVGLHVQTFDSADAFLEQSPQSHPSCIVLDVWMPGTNGLELQERLRTMPDSPPIIFLSGHGDVPMSVHAMRTGALHFLEKPVDDQDLITAIDQALMQDRLAQDERDSVETYRVRLNTLTSREFEVLRHVISGCLNKQIASQLAISEKTVKIHRGRVMAKLGVQSVAELVRFAGQAGIDPLD